MASRSEPFRKLANAVYQALKTPLGKAGFQLLTDTLGEHLKLVIREQHELHRAETEGHPHLINALIASTQRDYESHLGKAIQAYMQHANGPSVTYANFYANFWTATSCVKYGDTAAARTYLVRAYQVGEALLESKSNTPVSRADPEFDRRMAVAGILDEIQPIVTKAG